eukprot:Polyplicarium_translucidae@DN3653_c0_g1_i1.p1
MAKHASAGLPGSLIPGALARYDNDVTVVDAVLTRLITQLSERIASPSTGMSHTSLESALPQRTSVGVQPAKGRCARDGRTIREVHEVIRQSSIQKKTFTASGASETAAQDLGHDVQRQ